MPIPTTGPISFGDLQNEFGGSDPISMNEYYGWGPSLPPTNSINASVSMADFRGTYDTFYATISSNTTNLNLYTYLQSLGWNGFSKVALTIASGIYVYSTSTSVAAISVNNFPKQVLITNLGFIMGRGGNGGDNSGGQGRAGAAGGPAIILNSPGVSLLIQNQTGAYIGGGGGGGAGAYGGGGGGGAGGGVGGTGGDGAANFSGGAGGAPGLAGGSGGGQLPGGGGGAGGAGGGYNERKGTDDTGSGGGGGRIFTGSGGAPNGGGGAGGAGAGVGSPSSKAQAGGGGGGWGAAGGSSNGILGGAGGKAVNIVNGSVSVVTGGARIYGAIS